MRVIGIDPGANGAIAYVGDNSEIYIYDMPSIKIELSTKTKSGKKRTRSEINIPSLVSMLESLKDSTDLVCIEKVHSMPKQGISSQFTFGKSYGIVLGILGALKIRTIEATPQEWKKNMLKGQPKGKNSSIQVASSLFPNVKLFTDRGRALDGRADALLIALHGRTLTYVNT